MSFQRSLVFVAVLACISARILYFPHAASPRQTLDWRAVDGFYSGSFRQAGFTIECDIDVPSCKVVWRFLASSSPSPVDVYECDQEADTRRDDVLSRFLTGARPNVSGDRVSAAGTLKGFFQSGLRRVCDVATRRARDRATATARIPPFRFAGGSILNGREPVESIDPSFGVIPTGLPQRPSHAGDFFATAGWNASSSASDVSAIRLAPASASPSLIVLDPSVQTACQPTWPGGPDQSGCGSVTILPCSPSADADCQRPVLLLYALRGGRTIVRVGGSGVGRVYSRALDRLKQDELVSLTADAPELFVGSERPGLPFLLRLHSGNTIPVSRLRLANGRWQRWVESSIEAWFAPVVSRYNELARANVVRSEQSVRLSLNLSLQHELEAQLETWMRSNEEPNVVRHIRGHFASRTHVLSRGVKEHDHRRPIPEAGITVLDADTGAVLAVASYPPRSALTTIDGVPAFAPGWESRLVGNSAPDWVIRQVVELLDDRLSDDTNSNFVPHPIGSTFKPILLSLTMDDQTPSGLSDGVGRLYNLVVAGHAGTGGDRTAQLSCASPKICQAPAAEAVAGLPVGPWGQEEGSHGGAWIGRWEFLIGSCNKFAVTLGVLSLLDWQSHGAGAPACCWNQKRDSFGFGLNQTNRGVPNPSNLVTRPSAVPPLGPAIQMLNDHVVTTSNFGEAPIFSRLQEYFGVSPRTRLDDFDSQPWLACDGLATLRPTDLKEIGTVVSPQLQLSRFPVGAPFTNLFTGASHNWWTDLKLAEAYARIATNRPVNASFCSPSAPSGTVFANRARQGELIKILSRQRTAPWVETPQIDRWETSGSGTRTAISKTGTSLRQEGYRDTATFAVVAGAVGARDTTDNMPIRLDRGVVVVAHVDEVGISTNVTHLVDSVFPTLRRRLIQ
jgi:hypothetical protein